MPTAWIVIVIALAGGVAVGLQSPMTSQISTRLGVWQSVFLVHLSGAVAAATLLLLRGGDGGFAW